MFLKIFLSFWLIVGLFVAAQEVAGRLSHNEEQRTLAVVRTLVDDARAVVAAYEQRGTAGALKAAGAFEQRRGVSVDLLDARRTSVLGRPMRPAEVEMARLADRIAAAGLPNAAFNAGEGMAAQEVITGSGERMTLVVGLPRSTATIVSRALLVSWPVRLAVILLIGGVVSFVVARHLTRPIVDVSQAANALAEGRLQTRLGPAAGRRRDELGALARDFDRMAAHLEALVAGQRRLLGDVSHELRSPLARLTVALGLARQRSTADAGEYLARIEREASRLDRLIEQLLTLARIETGVDADQRGRFDLAGIVQDVVGDADFEARASGKRVALRACEPAPMTGMAELMRSAIENVVRNAIRHTAPATTVDVGLRVSDQGRAEVSIRDRGCGVDDAAVTDIFKPFWRAPGTAGTAPDGAGLGLAIADHVVRMHGGQIAAANLREGGLQVTIEVPVSRS